MQAITPKPGMSVKLKKGMAGLTARRIQHVLNIKKLSLEDYSLGISSQADIDAEGGYWITTDYTKGEWWAWSHFREA